MNSNNPSRLTPKDILSHAKGLLMHIPFREDVDENTGETIKARIATSEELQRIVTFASKGQLFTETSLEIDAIDGAPTTINTNKIVYVKASLKLATGPGKIIDLGSSTAEVPDITMDNAVGVAQSNAIKNALRNCLGLRAESAEKIAVYLLSSKSNEESTGSLELQEEPLAENGVSMNVGTNKGTVDVGEHSPASNQPPENDAFSLSLVKWDVNPALISKYNEIISSNNTVQLASLITSIRTSSPVLMKFTIKKLIAGCLHDEKQILVHAQLRSCTTEQIKKIAKRLLKLPE